MGGFTRWRSTLGQLGALGLLWAIWPEGCGGAALKGSGTWTGGPGLAFSSCIHVLFLPTTCPGSPLLQQCWPLCPGLLPSSFHILSFPVALHSPFLCLFPGLHYPTGLCSLQLTHLLCRILLLPPSEFLFMLPSVLLRPGHPRCSVWGQKILFTTLLGPSLVEHWGINGPTWDCILPRSETWGLMLQGLKDKG